MIESDDLPVAPRRDPAPQLAHWPEGNEICPTCLQLYAIETEVRCIDCDQPYCSFCAVTVSLHVATYRCADCCEEAS